MLKINAVVKSKDFEFTDLDGEVYDLYVGELCVKDTDRLIDLQKPLLDDENHMLTMWDIHVTRVMCSVKVKETNDYFWKCNVDEFKDMNYPNKVLDAIINVVEEINPLNSPSLDEKKSKS